MSTLALVTEASSRIGNAYARKRQRQEFDLIVVGRRRERLDELAASAAPAGRTVEPLVADLATTDGIAAVRPIPPSTCSRRRHQGIPQADENAAVVQAVGRDPELADRSVIPSSRLERKGATNDLSRHGLEAAIPDALRPVRERPQITRGVRPNGASSKRRSSRLSGWSPRCPNPRVLERADGGGHGHPESAVRPRVGSARNLTPTRRESPDCSAPSRCRTRHRAASRTRRRETSGVRGGSSRRFRPADRSPGLSMTTVGVHRPPRRRRLLRRIRVRPGRFARGGGTRSNWGEHFQVRPLNAWQGSVRGVFSYAAPFIEL